MNKIFFSIRRSLATLSIALIMSGCAGVSGIKASDPHLVGNRDMNYDHLIVPGVRIGPVRLGGTVSDAVQHLGEPDSAWRSTGAPGYNGDIVQYYYKNECIGFKWVDSGVEPQIGWGLSVDCAKWTTADGLHVGMPIKDIIPHLGQYCAFRRDDGGLIVSTKDGIWFVAADRNSPVSVIHVMPASTNWWGMCKD